MTNFKVGDIVRCNIRTGDNTLFLLVLNDPKPVKNMFRAVVLSEFGTGLPYKEGSEANNWLTDAFDLSSREEYVRYYSRTDRRNL